MCLSTMGLTRHKTAVFTAFLGVVILSVLPVCPSVTKPNNALLTYFDTGYQTKDERAITLVF